MAHQLACKSSRDVDIMLDRFEKELSFAIRHEVREQAARVEAHGAARERHHLQYDKVATRTKESDSLKVALMQEAPAMAFVVNFTDPPKGVHNPQKAYRAIPEHNVLIEWVRHEVAKVVAASASANNAAVGILVSATPFLLSFCGSTLSEEALVATIVRATYFASLKYISPTCYLLVENRATKNIVLSTLRQLRQDMETEGFDWFL